MKLTDHHARQESERLHEASRLLLDSEARPGAPRRREKLMRWAQRDRHNFEALAKVWSLKTAFSALDPAARTAILRELARKSAPADGNRPRTLARWRTYAAAATVLLIVAGAGLVLHSDGLPYASSGVTYTTGKAQFRHIAFPDGTRIVLDADSALNIAYGNNSRRATLERGEAFFQVHHDPKHPFTVNAGSIQVRDLGTAFDVGKTLDDVTVSVARGLVEISHIAPSRGTYPPSAGGTPEKQGALTVSGGHRVVASNDSHTFHISKTGTAEIASWRHGKLHFRNTPLSQVIRRLDRYSELSIRFAKPGIGDLRFTGTVFIKNIGGWLDAVCQVFALREVRFDNDEVVLYAARPVDGSAYDHPASDANRSRR